ncbi:hypothetical protein CCMSSC00406_0002937 [Pleurotus cornucopiae]|uniref:Uncharacterized protein n=1 Tax=Pleurotus cornucopiae TaxID=5321 RepID=A0ACB7J4E1_PLECO|nr:hypothetical protein CCMSSC00406_0002937 [Pleurotus cornucopiae]
MTSSDASAAKSSQTIVKLRDGSGELPLIVLHGGGGTIHAFGPLKNKFRSALWAIQVTPETPMVTLVGQPQASLRSLNGLFEQNGDVVSQLALIDHFPTTFLAPTLGIDVERTPLHHTNARKEFIDASFSNLVALTRRDGGGNLPRRVEVANGVVDALHGRPISPFIRSYYTAVEQFLNQVFDFLLFLITHDADKHSGLVVLEAWLQKARAPISVYLGSYGMVGSILPKHCEMWYDLRIRRCFPQAEITYLTGGHFDILAADVVIEGLQHGYSARTRVRM